MVVWVTKTGRMNGHKKETKRHQRGNLMIILTIAAEGNGGRENRQINKKPHCVATAGFLIF
jgi:hypothetical protein